jgi:hypothetical protein
MRTTRDGAANIIRRVCGKIPALSDSDLSIVLAAEKMAYRVQAFEDGPVAFVPDLHLYRFRDSNGEEGESEIITALLNLIGKPFRESKAPINVVLPLLAAPHSRGAFHFLPLNNPHHFS